MIDIQNVNKWFGDFHVLKDASIRVAKGEVIVVCGPSGSGKSTLIKCVNGLEPFQEGTITVNGVSVGAPDTNLPELRSQIGMVFQNFELFPHMTAMQNICLSQLKVLGRSQSEAQDRANKLLDRVGLSASSTRPNFREVSNSVWPSPARWPWIRSPCCSMSPPPRSILK